MESISFLSVVVLVIFILSVSLVTIQQGTVGVVTMFGKYRRVLLPGLNIRIPVIEQIYRRISVQNQSIELQFQAITMDQANVYFKAMLLFSVLNNQEETIKNVAFKFIDTENFMQALVRTVEGSVRSFAANKRQSEIIQLRREIVESIKEQLDVSLESWGYHLIDLQMNDITFDEPIMKSMAQIVASNNLKAAAENEGQALLIRKTKEAEAEGNAIKISADAEKMAAQLRGQGIALFREEVARGMTKAAEEMKGSGLDVSVILFSMWTDSIKHFAENGQGNMMFLDGSPENMRRTMQQMMGLAKGITPSKDANA